MATQSVLGKEIPACHFIGNEIGFDTNDPATSAVEALKAVEAINSVIMANIEGDQKGFWTDEFIWNLHQGQEALSAFARQQIAMMDHELWYTHALLGAYGAEAKAKAERELAEATDDRSAA